MNIRRSASISAALALGLMGCSDSADVSPTTVAPPSTVTVPVTAGQSNPLAIFVEGEGPHEIVFAAAETKITLGVILVSDPASYS